MRDLDQQPCPVAGFRITTAGATMRQVDQNLNTLFDDPVTLLTSNAGHKPDAASIVLVRRIIKTLLRRQTVVCLPVSQRYLRGKRRSSLVLGETTGGEGVLISCSLLRGSTTTNDEQPTTAS